jgi:hypothetical protein
MAGVDAEHVLEVAAVDDQDPVEALAAEGADPTLGVRIRIRGSDGRPGNPHALAAEDLVEGAAELTVAIVKEKAEGLFPVGQVHQQVARLLCDPAPIRVARARRDRPVDVRAGDAGMSSGAPPAAGASEAASAD